MLVDPLSIDAWVDAIRTLSADHGRVAPLAELARRNCARPELSLEANVARFHEIYQRAIARTE